MQSISEIMTQDVTVVAPTDNLQQAAQLMRERDIGALPVCDGTRLVGMITDRDITIRAVADGKSPGDVQVSEVMSDQVFWCYEDQSVEEVLQEMGNEQIRRIPVVSRDKRLVGVVSLGDMAVREAADMNETLEEISQPSVSRRPGTEAGRPH
ncbi:CBS domain-containing protein [Janthinobacterium sp. 17J80-10]|uniref:CBS domain-containing protein n=1 Tax=Janthinobacterium sp. 17J80-10 TaxID=2497863 RepID=UPI0010057AA6|nr:CBS domain-containing protein [Janthinobacterium sp. 17J80-10]QAU34264.1 CBS domain-containing protein [Janthinobacterium sp. 17J80-10]